MDVTYYVLLALFPACSLAGLAALLRSRQRLTYRTVASAMLNSGILGVGAGCLHVHYYGQQSLLMTVGLSILGGLGGNAMLDFAIETLKNYIKSQVKNE